MKPTCKVHRFFRSQEEQALQLTAGREQTLQSLAAEDKPECIHQEPFSEF